MNKATSKILSLLLAVCLTLGGIPLTTAAAESDCTHVHGADCSYVEVAACRHEHGEACGGLNPVTPTNAVTVANLDELDEYIQWQGFDYGEIASRDEITLPDKLTGADADGNPIMISGVTWQSVPDFDPYASAWYHFSPELPEGYALEAGAEAPVISIFIRPEGGVRIMPLGDNEPYIDANGQEQICSFATRLISAMTTLTDGWYLASETLNYTSAITVSGDVHLILEDGCNLTVTGGFGSAGINVTTGSSLTIYGQSGGTGRLTAAGGSGGYSGSGYNGAGAGIGGNGGYNNADYNGETPGAITINGGIITATGGSNNDIVYQAGGGAGIGGGGGFNWSGGAGGVITINGGTVTATGGVGLGSGAGIGGAGGGGNGSSGNSGYIIITGSANVTATGGDGANSGGNGHNGSAGIGSGGARNTGSAGDVDSIMIDTTGTVIATGGNGGNSTSTRGGNGGAGIGTGGTLAGAGSTGSIIIQSDNVTATGGTGGTGPTNGNTGASIGAGGDGAGNGVEISIIKITAQPVSTAVTGGSISGSLTVAASVSLNGTPSYQWYSNTIASNTGGTSISGETTASFTIPTTLAVGTYYYFCEISAAGAATVRSSVAAVTVLASPSLTLSVTPSVSQTYPGVVTLTAALTGAAPSNSGKTIKFTVNGTQHTETANSSGQAVYTVSGLTPGTYAFGASFDADANNNAAAAAQITNYTVGLGTQATLTLIGLNNSYTYGDAAFNLSTSGGSGSGAVSYASDNAGVAGVTGSTVTINKAGTFAITATKAADSNYAEASVTSGTVNVSPATPNVTLSATGGSNLTDPIILTATVSAVGTGVMPDGTVTFSEGGTTLGTETLDTSGRAAYTVYNPTVGSHTYTAAYSGQTDYYNTNNANHTVGVGLADQSPLSITGKPTAITYGDNGFTLSTSGGSGSGAVTFSAPANNVLAVTSGGALTIIGAGSLTVTAAKAADNSYNQASASLDITVAPRDITHATISVTGGRVYTGSQLQPVFTVSDGAIAITSGDYTNAYGVNIDAGINCGSVTLTGQRNYTGTKAVNFDIELLSLTGAVITLAAGPYVYTGSAVTPAVTSVMAGGVTVPASEYDVSYSSNTNPGTAAVTVTAKASSTNFTGSESTAFTITSPTAYALTITAGTGGSIAAGTSGSYAQGDVISIAASANSNYSFSGWTSSYGGSFGNAGSASTTFIMPGNATTITASFTYTGSSGGSSGRGSNIISNATITTTYPVTVTTNPDYPTTAKTTLTTSTDKNNALTFTITKAMVQKALDKAKEEAKKQDRESFGYALEFIFSTNKTINSLNITFNADALALLESAGVKETTVTTNAFRWSFDLAAIKEINEQRDGRAVTVSASRFSKLSDEAKALIGSRLAWDVTISCKNEGKTVYISDLGKGLITMGMRYSPASSENTGNLAVVYVPGSGKPQTLTDSSYENGWMIWRRSSLSVYGVGYITPSPAFTDTENHWGADDIDYVTSRGLISGTSATEFSPDTAITRAAFLMALGKLSGADVSGYTASSFTDVPATSPAMPYIEWAVKNNIVQGVGNNQFGSDNLITREQMAVMMVNYTKAAGYTLPVSRQAYTFADDEAISAYAKDAVKAIQQTGVISGKPNNLFDPQGSATRAEAAAILRRFAELVID